VLSVEDWAEIRRLRRSERLAISEIARVLGISRNTVKAALASDGPPKYQRAGTGSVADEAEPRIRELLAAYPRMPATMIAERIGWSYSIRTLGERVTSSARRSSPRSRCHSQVVSCPGGGCVRWSRCAIPPSSR
jgi:transposase